MPTVQLQAPPQLDPAAQKSTSRVPSKYRSTWWERLIYPVALITAALGLVYWYWTTTPTYALTAVVMSIKDHDTESFEKYIDIDSIVGSALDDVADGPVPSAISSHIDSRLPGVGAILLQFFRNDIIAIAHEKLVHAVADRNMRLNIKDKDLVGFLGPMGSMALPFVTSHTQTVQNVGQQGATIAPSTLDATGIESRNAASGPDLLDGPELSTKVKSQLRDYGLTGNGFRGVKYLNLESGVAHLGLEFYSPKLGQTWIAQFKMEDVGGYWRITQLSNLKELVDKYVALGELRHLSNSHPSHLF